MLDSACRSPHFLLLLLSALFQRIARRDKKAFLSDQCKEIEENNRMGKTGDLFKKIRDAKGTFHEKMGSIKDRNSMDLTEAEDIKKRWQEYTELYRKDLHDPDSHDGVIIHLKPDIQERKVKWALGSSNYHTIALISYTSKIMLKILQARLQKYMNRELPDVQVGFRKGRGTRDQITNIRDHRKNKRVPVKHLFLLY